MWASTLSMLFPSLLFTKGSYKLKFYLDQCGHLKPNYLKAEHEWMLICILLFLSVKVRDAEGVGRLDKPEGQ